MSTKTVALETSVYDRLARHKRGSESFTRTIDRLLGEVSGPSTCAEEVREAAAIWGTADSGRETAAKVMEAVVRGARKDVEWEVERPE